MLGLGFGASVTTRPRVLSKDGSEVSADDFCFIAFR